MKLQTWLLCAAILLSAGLSALAQDVDSSRTTTAESRPQSGDDTHPLLSNDASWAGSLVIGVLGLFLAAGIVGPVMRAMATEEEPPPTATAHHH